MKSSKFLVCAVVIAAVSSCRIAKVGKDSPIEQASPNDGDVSAKSPIVQPQRQVSNAAQAIPVTLNGDAQLKERLVLRLDYFAAPKPGAVTIPSCYDSIAGHLVIARLVCGADTNLQIDVQASQVDQVCYTQSTTPKVPAKTPINLPGCVGPSTLQVYGFTPEIKVEVVASP